MLILAVAVGVGFISSVSKVDVAPVLDGRRDAVYDDAMPLEGFSFIRRMDLSWSPTSVRFVHDGKNLYGFVFSYQGGVEEEMRKKAIRRDRNIWRGDSVELFFYTGDGVRYFAFNPCGGCHWSVARQNEAHEWIHDAEAQSGFSVRTAAAMKGWNAEFSIPLAELQGREWGLNIVRNRKGDPTSSWRRLEEPDWWGVSPTTGSLRLLDDSLGKYAFERLPAFDAKKPFVFAVTNDAGEIIYDYRYRLPKPYVRVWPGNVKGNLLLDCNLRLVSSIGWECRHNLKGAKTDSGGKVKTPFVLRFFVPEGICVVSGRKTGSVLIDGKKLDVYEQPERFAYNSRFWFGSRFTCTLREGVEGRIYYEMDHVGGKQERQVIPFKVLSVPGAEAPKRFFTGHYNLWPRTLADTEKWRKTGANTFAVRGLSEDSCKIARELLAAGLNVRRGDYFWPGAATGNEKHLYEKWTKDDPSARALDIDMKPIPNAGGYQISPSYRGRYYDEAIEKEIAFCKATGVSWWAFDLEGYIQRRGELGDFHPDTIAAFKTRWRRKHPGKPVPEPRVFERDPGRHPVEHKVFVDTKCELWGEFFGEMKRRVEKAIGRKMIFSEWSMNTIADVEARNHSLRGADFFRAFDMIELDTYAGIDRDLRQILDYCATYRREFPDVPLEIIITPTPHRLGDKPRSYYWTTAPAVHEENVCVFKEAATLGARGVITWYAGLGDLEYLRQYAKGVNIIRPYEDIILDGRTVALKTDCPGPVEIADHFHGKYAIWKNQPRVFARARILGNKALVSVSEYREGLSSVTVELPFSFPVTVKDAETGEVLVPDKAHLKVALTHDRRCRLLSIEKEDRDE